MHGSSFEYCVKTARQEWYNIMCSIEAHYRDNPTVNYDASSGGGIPLTPESTEDLLVLLGLRINFIGSWIK